MAIIASARYGKDNVRVYKVDRNEETGVQTVTEMTVCVLLEGEIDVSYSQADNSVIVATDSVKNTCYIVAKENPVTPPELYASILSSHFLTKYPHIHKATAKVITHRWTRMTVEGKPHPHSFYRDGQETRNVEVTASRKDGVLIRSAIVDLLVLKSTGSQFHSFIKDEYTTLKDTYDRILSTSIDAGWEWKDFKDLDAVKAAVPKFDHAFDAAREITMRLFADIDSPSVQGTMYKMCEEILAAVPEVETVDYTLPNKHYFEIDLSWHKGLQNTGKDAEVYAPQSGPNGLIHCKVARSDSQNIPVR